MQENYITTHGYSTQGVSTYRRADIKAPFYRIKNLCLSLRKSIFLIVICVCFLTTNYLQYKLMFHIDCLGNKHDSMAMTFCGLSFVLCFLMSVCIVIEILAAVIKGNGNLKLGRLSILFTQSCIVINGVYGIIFLYIVKEWEKFA